MARERSLVQARERQQHRSGVVLHHVGGQHAPRGENARVIGHDDARNPQYLRQRAGVHRPRAAEGDEGELARVVAPLHADQADRARHVLVGDADHALGRLPVVEPQGFGQTRDPGLHRLHVERHPAAQELFGIEAAQEQVRVRDGHLIPLAVAYRAGVRARALGPDGQSTPRIHPGDGAAARAHRVDVDEGDPDRAAGDFGLRREADPAVQQGDVRARPAHVERDSALEPRPLRHLVRAHDAACGA